MYRDDRSRRHHFAAERRAVWRRRHAREAGRDRWVRAATFLDDGGEVVDLVERVLGHGVLGGECCAQERGELG